MALVLPHQVSQTALNLQPLGLVEEEQREETGDRRPFPG